MPASELDALGLSPEDGDAVAEAHLRSNTRVWDVVRPRCQEIVRDPEVVSLLGAMTCVQLIEKLSTRSDRSAAVDARRQVAEVHAGMRPAPREGEPRHPLFDVLMAVTSEGRRFEADLAESFGPDEARRIWRSMTCAASRD